MHTPLPSRVIRYKSSRLQDLSVLPRKRKYHASTETSAPGQLADFRGAANAGTRANHSSLTTITTIGSPDPGRGIKNATAGVHRGARERRSPRYEGGT